MMLPVSSGSAPAVLAARGIQEDVPRGRCA